MVGNHFQALTFCSAQRNLLLGVVQEGRAGCLPELTDPRAAPTAAAGTVCLIKAVKALLTCKAKSSKYLRACKSLIT